MKYFALHLVSWLYYLIGVLWLIASTLAGGVIGSFSYLSLYGGLYSSAQIVDSNWTVNGSIIGFVVGFTMAVSFFAIAQLVQLILDTRAEQRKQTEILELQAKILRSLARSQN